MCFFSENVSFTSFCATEINFSTKSISNKVFSSHRKAKIYFGDKNCTLNIFGEMSAIYLNRPFQGSYRHIAGGAKTLGRARGHQWRPYYLLVNERKLPFEILPFFSKNVYISISNSYFLDNR